MRVDFPIELCAASDGSFEKNFNQSLLKCNFTNDKARKHLRQDGNYYSESNLLGIGLETLVALERSFLRNAVECKTM